MYNLAEKYLRFIERYNMVGANLVLIDKNRNIECIPSGYQSIENNVITKTSAIYRIASISKVIVAICIMQLYDEGLVDLDEDISKYLGFDVRNPGFPNDKITLRMIMTQTSSITDNGSSDGGIYKLWIKDVARIRAKAPERDNFIRSVAEKDGQAVTIGVESSVESKDTLATMQSIFNGRRIIRGIPIKGDKVVRFSPVEPIFEGGNVYIMCGVWNLDWINELKEFPSGKHDDQVDNMSAGFILCSQGTGEVGRIGVSGV